MRNALIIIYLGLCSGLYAGSAYGQTFEDGYQTYMRNQYPVAELQFKAALKKAKVKEDMAFILKFIGICQYMRGDKKMAGSSFYQAVGYDKGITVDDSEVLDPSVVSFFEGIKGRWIKDQQNNPPPSAPPVAAPLPKAQAKAPIAKASKSTLALKAKTPKSAPASSGSSPLPQAANEGARFSFFHLLPFGGGQFYNRSYVLGGTVALLEIGGLYKYFDLQKRIDERSGLNGRVAEDGRLTTEQITDFIKSNNEHIDDLKNDQTLALSLFIGTWAIGVVESILNSSSPAVSSSSSSGSLDSPSAPPLRWAAGWSPEARGQWQLHMQMDLP